MVAMHRSTLIRALWRFSMEGVGRTENNSAVQKYSAPVSNGGTPASNYCSKV